MGNFQLHLNEFFFFTPKKSEFTYLSFLAASVEPEEWWREYRLITTLGSFAQLDVLLEPLRQFHAFTHEAATGPKAVDCDQRTRETDLGLKV